MRKAPRPSVVPTSGARARRCALPLLLALCAAGCGQKGPLTLPDAPAKAKATPASAPAGR